MGGPGFSRKPLTDRGLATFNIIARKGVRLNSRRGRSKPAPRLDLVEWCARIFKKTREIAVTPNSSDLAELEPFELEARLESSGCERFHARQVYRWIHKCAVTDFALMTNLSRPLRGQLASLFVITTPRLVSDERSVDGTRKFVLELVDGRRIESVFIPDTPSMTFCISTQVGCAMSCGFCLTGKMGLVRNLTAGEIVGQVRVLAEATGLLNDPFNIVLMGMGEPLHNYDNTMKALRMLHSEHGLAVSPRRVTLSTVGVIPGLERLAHEPLMPNLAVSLHATTDEQRTALVPPNRRYPLAAILEACRSFPLKKRSRITFEYVMLDRVNDTPEDARRLVKLLAGIKAKVNLIPLNPAPGIPYARPSDERVNHFAQILADRHITVSVRKSRGQDIRAACGQLIVEGGVKKTAAQQMAMLLG
jgi:23S rRNA (adenine2503-C2)-methyltransferase